MVSHESRQSYESHKSHCILGKTLHQLSWLSWQLQNWLSEFHLGSAHLDHVRDQLIMTVKAEMMESRPKRATLPSGQISKLKFFEIAAGLSVPFVNQLPRSNQVKAMEWKHMGINGYANNT